MKDLAPNLAGMKVSDAPFEAVAPYLGLGLDVFVGQEPLAIAGIEAGAIGSVSGLAAAFPGIVARLVHELDRGAHDAVASLRERLGGIPFHAALKEVLVSRDVLPTADVRPPLRGLTDAERRTVLGIARELDTV